MPVATWSVTVNRKPEDVFAYLADFSKHAEWSPKPYKVETLTEGPVRVGSKFRSVGWIPRDGNQVNEVEITAFDAPTRLAFESHEPQPGPPIKNEFRLSASNGGTRIDRSMDMPKPTGALGVAFPLLLRAVIKPGVQKGLDMLKANLNAGA